VVLLSSIPFSVGRFRAKVTSRKQLQGKEETRVDTGATNSNRNQNQRVYPGSRLYFTQNLLQRDENAQKKIFDTINPPKNIIFWKISVIFWGTVKAGHKITRCNCCCPKSSSAASPAASFPHSREFPLPAALPRQPLVRSLSVLSRSRYCAARKIACKPFHSSGLRKRGSAAKRSLLRGQTPVG
jgi:hypothetical protein